MHRLLAHIFDKSACLTKRQLKDYVTGVMAEEECYVVERHATDCSFCSEAIDGLGVYGEEAVNQLETLTPEFMHDHFQKTLPPVHLNSIAAAGPASVSVKHKKSGISWLHVSALAATLLLSFFLIRGWKPERPPGRQAGPLVAADTTAAAIPQPAETKKTGKTGALPPAEKRARSTAPTPEVPVPETAAAAPQHNTKAAGVLPESNKPADTVRPAENPLSYSKVPAEVNIAAEAPEKDSINHRQLADEAFRQAHYTKALRHYRQILNSSTATREDRDAAGIQAARCYMLLGSKAQAVTLLREIADGNSPQSGEAGKLLAELN